MLHLLRFALMFVVLAAGYVWLQPRRAEDGYIDVHFVDRAEEAGCRNVHTMVRLAEVFDNIMPWLASVGAAAAAGDYDGDGFADLYVTNSGRGDNNRLFRNRGDGAFEDVTAAAGVGCGNPEGASMHAVWGDVDNDGDLDLYVVKWGEANTLFRNDSEAAGPRFTNISRDAGVDNWGYANGATFLDYDRDGRLDILVGNYFAETIEDPKTGQRVRNDLWRPVSTRVMHETFTHARNGGRNVLYQNVSDSTAVRFEERTESAGLKHGGWALAVGSGDLNNDGWPDLYIANDFGPDEFYLNTGATEQPPRFRLIVDPKGHPGVGNDWWKGMNVDMGDVNNDGYLDIYVTNILERRYKTDEGNMLWLNCVDPECPGGRGFRNIAEASGTNDGGWGWGGKFADFNNDGLLDIYTVNGFVTGDPDHNYWFAIQEMVTQTKNQTADARDWPVMGTRDLSGRERGRLFIQRQQGREAGRQQGKRTNGQAATNETDLLVGTADPSRDAVPSRDREGAVKPPGTLGSPESAATDAAQSTIDNRQSTIGDRQSTIPSPRFVELAERAGITDTYNGRGIAVADFNDDGWLDFYVANQGAPSCYYVNQTGMGVGTEAQSHEATKEPSRDREGAESSGNHMGAESSSIPPGRVAEPGIHPLRSGFLWIKLIGRPDLPLTVGDRTFASTRDAVGARHRVESRRGSPNPRGAGRHGLRFAIRTRRALRHPRPERRRAHHHRLAERAKTGILGQLVAGASESPCPHRGRGNEAMRQEATSQTESAVRYTDSRRDGEPSRDRGGAVSEPRASARAAPARVNVTVVIVLSALFAATAFFAWSRGGMFDLPSVSGDVTLQSAGLADISASKSLGEQIEIKPRRNDVRVHCDVATGGQSLETLEFGAYQVYDGLRDVRNELELQGLWKISDGVRFDPHNLVLANYYRLEVFRLRRAFLIESRRRGEIAPQFPPYLDRQPIAFFEELVKKHPSRETKLALALAWVDEMLLFPALEIKAPSSVQSVDILTEVLNEPGNEWYVPALFARGLNHLHRPARLVWPESAKTPKDAAVQDIAKCVAIGRKLGVGSPRLQATLAMTLGDAYVKAGRISVARSWWQIAQNLCHEDDVQQAIRRRYAWNDEDILDRLEEELDRARSELDHPMTDLALMWN